MQHILEKRRKHNLATFVLFISYGKACGNVNQGNTWQFLREGNIPGQLFFCVFFIGMTACRGPWSSVVCLHIYIYISIPCWSLSSYIQEQQGVRAAVFFTH
jgi:hypothetical protein